MIMQVKNYFSNGTVTNLPKYKQYLNDPIFNQNCKIIKMTRKRRGQFCENYFLRREKHLKYLLLNPKSMKYVVTVAKQINAKNLITF